MKFDMERTGFEPVISSLRGRRVGQLHQRGWIVELVGLEPTASSLQVRCSS